MAEITPTKSALVGLFLLAQSHLASPGYFQREAAEARNEHQATAMWMAEAETLVGGAVVPAARGQEVSAASPATEPGDGLTPTDKLAKGVNDLVRQSVKTEEAFKKSLEPVEKDIAVPPAVNDNVAPPGVAANDNAKPPAPAPAPDVTPPVPANDNAPAPETPPAPDSGPAAPTTNVDTQV